MKPAPALFLIPFLLVLGGCRDANQKRYDQVMEIHDEVMPKMNDLYKAKVELNNRLSDSARVTPEEREAIRQKIAHLDSASESMMVWMRQFNPVPDSAGKEKARAYLEAELVKIRHVKEDIQRALEEAQSPD